MVKPYYLLDTNIVSEQTYRDPDENVMHNLRRYENVSAISALTWFELCAGVERLEKGRKKTQLEFFLQHSVKDTLPIIAYDSFAAQINAQIQTTLATLGKVPPFIDALLAATAIANNMIFVTRNVKDFSAIAENFSLMLENWFE